MIKNILFKIPILAIGHLEKVENEYKAERDQTRQIDLVKLFINKLDEV